MDTYINFTQEQLFRYFRGEFSEKEKEQLDRWIGESAENADKFRKARILYDAFLMHASLDSLENRQNTGGKVRRIWKTAAIIAANIAAAAVIYFISGVSARNSYERELSRNMVKIEAPAGQRISFTLADGTEVHLNAGARLSYPTIFSSRERKVALEGEGYFSVTKDSRRPFVVGTYAADVEVLGTKFNVLADSISDRFVTTLVEGKVSVCDRNSRRYVLNPDEELSISSDGISLRQVNASRATRWTEGIISIGGEDFCGLMKRFELAYGVNIVILSDRIPELGYLEGNLRISEGIDFALGIVQEAADFTYRKDAGSNTIYIED